ncbi:hypothetical protein OU787_25675 [Kitasatospora sp. YST-16]|uniref:hypothetical protein n=1 Tax=Kitasatospora sp. YST-16 TaxID=2998080 RepID=UPI0022848F1E|nr:hypothetical protein [Kitasatospora sp. YST-16]WAL74586.1 hypothetical protein OU787_25675 [Kitasatospora sp. YST-16]WNW40644.1 hypothetical protein RKE32_25610 [Streptomyces sp. Li-HN-5-13]
MLIDRSLRASADLVVEVGDPGRSPLWQAVITKHTPQEFLAPLTQNLARELRDRPDLVLDDATARPALQTAWAPADGWTVEVDRPGGQLHAAPTGLCGFAALDPGSDGRAGYWFFGGSAEHRWLITLSPATPASVVRRLYADVADPAPVQRAPRALPSSHLGHLTITPAAAGSRTLPMPSGLATAIARMKQRSGPTEPLFARTPASPPPPRHR